MEEGKFQNGVIGGGWGVKVMTDEQMEMLRKQIAVYATICEQLVEMHKTISSQQDFAGMRLGNPYCDPLFSSAVHKIPSRQRWTPTQAQLRTLEHVFDQCKAPPDRQKIKDLAIELAQHGQISETNVYNWFQNRRALSKRKQSASVPKNGESEADTKVESAKENKTTEGIQPAKENETTKGIQPAKENETTKDIQPAKENKTTKDIQPDDSLPLMVDHMFLQSAKIGIDQLVGKMETRGSYNPFWQVEQYDLFGWCLHQICCCASTEAFY